MVTFFGTFWDFFGGHFCPLPPLIFHPDAKSMYGWLSIWNTLTTCTCSIVLSSTTAVGSSVSMSKTCPEINWWSVEWDRLENSMSVNDGCWRLERNQVHFFSLKIELDTTNLLLYSPNVVAILKVCQSDWFLRIGSLPLPGNIFWDDFCVYDIKAYMYRFDSFNLDQIL